MSRNRELQEVTFPEKVYIKHEGYGNFGVVPAILAVDGEREYILKEKYIEAEEKIRKLEEEKNKLIVDYSAMRFLKETSANSATKYNEETFVLKERIKELETEFGMKKRLRLEEKILLLEVKELQAWVEHWEEDGKTPRFYFYVLNCNRGQIEQLGKLEIPRVVYEEIKKKRREGSNGS